MEKSDTSKTTTIDSTKLRNQSEKFDTTTIDSNKISKYDLALQILLFGLAIILGITLAFRMFYLHNEDIILLQNPKFQIESLSSSSFSLLAPSIHPLIVLQNPDRWSLTLSVQNPNSNYNFYYDDFNASISYDNTLLWSANVLGKFNQDGKAKTLIDSTFTALPEPYEYWIGTSAIGDLASGRTTRFSVSLNGKIQISSHTTPSHITCRDLQVSCEGLQFEFSKDGGVGVLAIGSKACKVVSQDTRC